MMVLFIIVQNAMYYFLGNKEPVAGKVGLADFD